MHTPENVRPSLVAETAGSVTSRPETSIRTWNPPSFESAHHVTRFSRRTAPDALLAPMLPAPCVDTRPEHHSTIPTAAALASPTRFAARASIRHRSTAPAPAGLAGYRLMPQPSNRTLLRRSRSVGPSVDSFRPICVSCVRIRIGGPTRRLPPCPPMLRCVLDKRLASSRRSTTSQMASRFLLRQVIP